MRQNEPGDDKFASFVFRLNFDGLTGTKIILWLLAITIVSFAIGFGILALTGGFPPDSQNKDTPFRHSSMTAPNTTQFPRGDAASGKISITMGAGELSVDGGSPEGTIMEATIFDKAPEWQPRYFQTVSNSTAIIRMEDPGHKGKEWFAPHSPNSWDIRVADRVPVDLEIAVGAGHSSLSLGSLSLNSLTVSTGAGETDIDLTGYRGSAFTGSIDNGVGDLTIRVPRTSNMQVTVRQGVGDVTQHGFEQQHERYTTPGFDPALPASDLLINQGVGDITIEAV
ncbi:MAG: hypothetical protein GYA23_10575 [Methanomicrobiales archaeon]|nr:hypothetical protein [Methanomicrobiales archaeon]